MRTFVAILLLSATMAGCTSSTDSSSPAESAAPSDSATPVASSTTTPTPSSIATPTLSPRPTPTPVGPLTFVATGSMHTARANATATLLKTGKVLITGGDTSPGNLTNEYYATAELYDPATGTFTPTGSMHSARAGAAAALLSNGKVLIAGGEGCSSPKDCSDGAGNHAQSLASAELYDPESGKFARTGSMTAPRAYGAAAVLPDGRVLVVGDDSAAADLYSLESGKFVSGSEPIIEPPVTATFLPTNGKVLVTGDSASGFLAQLYDEHNRKFTTISLALPAGTRSADYQGLPVPRSGEPSAAALLKDGGVLLFDNGYLETYDPTSGKCEDAGFVSPAAQWLDPTATLLPDGSMLLEGGALWPQSSVESRGEPTNAAVLYYPTDRTTRTGSMAAAREFETATLLPDSSILIAGGRDENNSALASAELFKP